MRWTSDIYLILQQPPRSTSTYVISKKTHKHLLGKSVFVLCFVPRWTLCKSYIWFADIYEKQHLWSYASYVKNGNNSPWKIALPLKTLRITSYRCQIYIHGYILVFVKAMRAYQCLNSGMITLEQEISRLWSICAEHSFLSWLSPWDIEIIFAFYIIPPYWNGTESRDPSSWNTWGLLY